MGLQMMMVGRVLVSSFGWKEKVGEGRAEPVPGLGSFWWFPLLWVQFTSWSSFSSSSPLLPGVSGPVFLPREQLISLYCHIPAQGS